MPSALRTARLWQRPMALFPIVEVNTANHDSHERARRRIEMPIRRPSGPVGQ